MLEFIKVNYELIISCLVLLISVLIHIFKKKPVYNKLDEIKARVLEILPDLIAEVEKPGNGSLKKNVVLLTVQSFVAKHFGFYNFADIEAFVSDAIESILSTPKKKED